MASTGGSSGGHHRCPSPFRALMKVPGWGSLLTGLDLPIWKAAQSRRFSVWRGLCSQTPSSPFLPFCGTGSNLVLSVPGEPTTELYPGPFLFCFESGPPYVAQAQVYYPSARVGASGKQDRPDQGHLGATCSYFHFAEEETGSGKLRHSADPSLTSWL